MNPRNLTLVSLALGCLSLLATFVPTAAADPAAVVAASWGNGQPTEASPGDSARLVSVSLQNLDTITYTGVHATLHATAGATPSAGGGNFSSLSGTFAPGQVWVAVFAVDLAPSLAPDATLSLPITLTMEERLTTSETDYALAATVSLTGHAAVTLAPSSVALPGASHTHTTLTVSDSGTGKLAGLTVSLSPATGSTLAIDGHDNVFGVGALAAGDSRTLDLPLVTPSSGGPQSLVAALAYTNAAGATVSESRTLTLRVMDLPTPQVKATLGKSTLAAGRPATLDFTIVNGETSALDGLVASVKLPSGGSSTPFTVTNGTDVQALGSLAAGASTVMTLKGIVAKGAADTYPISLTLTWTEGGFTKTASFDFGILVVGTVDLALSGERTTFDNATGAVSLSGTVTNLGNAQAHNLYVSLAPSLALVPVQSIYLGDLDVNSPLPFVVATTSLNASAFQGGARGGFGGGFRGDGTGGSAGGFGGGGARGGNGAGGRGFNLSALAASGRAVTFVFTWNDDYGNTHTQTFVSPLNAGRGSATALRNAGTVSTSGASRLPWLGGGLVVLAALVGTVLVARRRRG